MRLPTRVVLERRPFQNEPPRARAASDAGRLERLVIGLSGSKNRDRRQFLHTGDGGQPGKARGPQGRIGLFPGNVERSEEDNSSVLSAFDRKRGALFAGFLGTSLAESRRKHALDLRE